MALTIYKKANVTALRDRRIAILGYGNQGRAHALNLRDSGLNVVIGQRRGKGHEQAQADGFSPILLAEAVSTADLAILTLTDESAADIYDALTAPKVYKGTPWRITGALQELLHLPYCQGQVKPVFEAFVNLMKPRDAAISARASKKIVFE